MASGFSNGPTMRRHPIDSCDAAVIPVCTQEYNAYIPNNNESYLGGVVVRNLPAGTDPELVKKEFLMFGPISKVEVMDGITFNGCHHIYLTFDRLSDARKAVLQMDNQNIFGRRCRVNYQQREPISKAYVEKLRKEEEEREASKAATRKRQEEEKAKKVEEEEKKQAKKWAPVETATKAQI